MFKVFLTLTLLAFSAASFLQREDETMFKFMRFVRQHNKEYNSVEEFQERFEIFRENLNKVEETDNYSPFMDHSVSEFRNRLNLNAAAIPSVRATSQTRISTLTLGEIPTEHDWRKQGAVNAIKDQGQCGSCWAFSAIANVEGQYFLKHKKLESFSEQQLVDCDREYDQGCNGGLMDYAFTYLKTNKIERESDYKYVARDQTCKYDAKKGVIGASGFKDISQNEDEILKTLYEVGPLSIAVDASDFQFYSGGILKSCSFYGLNHGITLVGFGEEKGIKFWIVRNSWGSGWGEAGYIRIARGKGLCGLNQNVSTVELN